MSHATPPADTRARILREAERLFRVYGYAKTTVADIAEACGMSPSNVYRFFPSKAAVNEAICGQIISEAERRLFDIVGLAGPASDRMRKFIIELNRYTLETLLDQKKVHEMVTAAMEEHWEVILAHKQRITGMMRAIIEEGMASGEFRRQDPARAAECARTAVAALWHPAMLAQCLDIPDKATVEEMAAFVLAALKN